MGNAEAQRNWEIWHADEELMQCLQGHSSLADSTARVLLLSCQDEGETFSWS